MWMIFTTYEVNNKLDPKLRTSWINQTRKGY
jgi:hypothetical protein